MASKWNSFIFALKHMLWVFIKMTIVAILMNTHNICFRAKLIKTSIIIIYLLETRGCYFAISS